MRMRVGIDWKWRIMRSCPRPVFKYYYALFREGLSNYPGNLQQNNLFSR
ncbi:hypothetical protein LMG26841_04360 [Achromobacter dolens]|uniref:Uncharacterized protein n=1 Tax=Achromobacter dolens TaxID=1287738 RepID=A0A6S7E727_9BURK|nr:hypothetical protein LMG26840_02702 [Achromobacter dolens]CAB3898656.1 hypothetical protein LMG26841_04360 [Achromobacter dolens]CUI29508.1 Uncharacterised protein [Achromobacter dolens]